MRITCHASLESPSPNMQEPEHPSPPHTCATTLASHTPSRPERAFTMVAEVALELGGRLSCLHDILAEALRDSGILGAALPTDGRRKLTVPPFVS